MPHPCPRPAPGGNGLGPLAAAIAVVLVLAAIARPVERAAAEAIHIVFITVAVIISLAVTAGAALLAARVYRWRAERTTAVPLPRATIQAPQEPPQALPAPQRRAIEAPKVIHGVVLSPGRRDGVTRDRP
jgi:hypothetical protein